MTIVVRHIEGDRFTLDVDGHQLVVDQSVDAGGGGAGPTPVELFVAALAACHAHYARHALRTEQHGALTVTCEHTMAAQPPWRVTHVDIDVQLPPGTPPARVAAVRRAVDHCTVTNTLRDAPLVEVNVAPREHASAA